MTSGQVPKMTRAAIAEILRQLPAAPPQPYDGDEQRQHPRWASHGTIEVRPISRRHTENVTGSVRNISEGGLGMSSSHYFEPDSVVQIVVRLPNAAFSAKACVRYCKKVRDQHMTGLAFIFGD